MKLTGALAQRESNAGLQRTRDGLVRDGLATQARPISQASTLALPERLRRPARRAADWVDGRRPDQVRLEDWSVPIGGEASTSLPPTAAVLPSLEPGGPVPEPSIRCLILTEVLDAGGVDEMAAFLARRLPRLGIRTMVAKTTIGGGRLASALASEGHAIREVPSADALASILSSYGPDVVSAHAPPAWALAVIKRHRVPVVETLHGLPTPVGTDWRHEPARSRMVDSLIAVSETVRQQYMNGNPAFSPRRIHTIPNGVNDQFRPVVDRTQARQWLGLTSEFVFVTLARITLQKNSFGLVAAFADLAATDSRVHLLMAGRCEEPRYARQVQRLQNSLPRGIAGRIHIRDNTPHVPAVLAAADCYVMDSFFEGWSLSVTEALACGLPVVTSEVGGAREQLGQDGERGFVVPNPLGDAATADWRGARDARFIRQPNRRYFVEAMASVVEQRSYWINKRAALAEESRIRFSPQACATAHAEVLFATAASGRLNAQ